MKEKECFKCKRVLPLSSFYKHKMMADGHLNKCKECTRSDVSKNRSANLEYYRKYDRERGNRQDADYIREWRKKYPNKYRAHNLINNAIRSGNLVKKSCAECDSELPAHAHHDDYSEPLNIRWLCPACHKQWHKENGEGLNA